MYLNPVAYNTRDMTDEMLLEVKCSKENIVIWREADISESVPIVIDSDTALPVKSKNYIMTSYHKDGKQELSLYKINYIMLFK